MNTREPPASVLNETTHVATGHRTTNPVARSLLTRRKAILYGTAAKVNPARTVARRAAKIARLLGSATGYYFWIIERIGAKDRTRFWVDDAAEANGTSSRTILRYNQQLEKSGFIQIKHRQYKGRNTYCEYVLNTINDLIEDYGTTAKKADDAMTALSPRLGYDKAVTAKRARKEESDDTADASSSLSVLSSSHPSGAKQAEAGRAGASPAAAPAGFATKGDTHSQNILTWIQQNEKTFTELGFKEQRSASLVKDVLRYTGGDYGRWTHFIEDIWPLLLEQCRASDWLSEKRCRVGFGWLFLQSHTSPGESNLQVFMFSQTYTSLTIPDVVWKPGQRVCVYGHPTAAIIRGFRPASLRVYRVYGETLTDPQEIEENTYEAGLSQLSEPEAVVLASVGTSDVTEVVEKPAPAPDEKALRDAEDDARLAQILSEMGATDD